MRGDSANTGRTDEVLCSAKVTVGGSEETEVSDVTVTPKGTPSLSRVVRTHTAWGVCRNRLRKPSAVAVTRLHRRRRRLSAVVLFGRAGPPTVDRLWLSSLSAHR